MNKEDIKISDWMRMITGEAPAVFFIEVFIRTFMIYLVLMIALRLMGSRMAGQLNRIEQASLVTLAAAIGVPIQTPERGILPTVIIALIVVIVGRWIALKASRNVHFEENAFGNITMLIKDGVIDKDALQRTTLTRERIFAQLRAKQIMQLGQVKRFYIEANGSFTLIKQEQEQDGLPIIPDEDEALRSLLAVSERQVCLSCGSGDMSGGKCLNCNDTRERQAVRSVVLGQDSITC